MPVTPTTSDLLREQFRLKLELRQPMTPARRKELEARIASLATRIAGKRQLQPHERLSASGYYRHAMSGQCKFVIRGSEIPDPSVWKPVSRETYYRVNKLEL